MKRKMACGVAALALTLLVLLPGCSKKGADEMLTLIPADAAAVVTFDFQKFVASGLFDLAMEKKPSEAAEFQKGPFKDYNDFVAKTGIDAKKDAKAAVLGIFSVKGSSEPEVAAVFDIVYQKEKILNVLRQNSVNFSERKYGSDTLYIFLEQNEGKPPSEMALCFLDPGHIAFGTPTRVQGVIDRKAGKGKDVLSNSRIKEFLGKTRAGAMIRLAVGEMPQGAGTGPGQMMPVDLSKIKGFLGDFDYGNKTLSGTLQLVSPDEQGNKQIADFLNGMKAMVAMGASKEPEVAELLNAITVTASGEGIKLNFAISQATLDKLKAKAKEKKPF